MNRTTGMTWMLAAALALAFVVIALLWRDVQGLKAQIALSNEGEALRRLAAVEAQADATESRLTALLLAAGAGANEVAAQIDQIQQEDFALTVPIEEEIPIDLEIPFTREIVVPINATIPIDTTVEIPINLGALGSSALQIPIRTTIPIDLDVPVTIDTTVPIQTTIPIALEVPVRIPLADSPLGDQLVAWQSALRDLGGQLVPKDRTE